MSDKQFNIKNIKLIVALGNPGKEYLKTRHNAGFIFIDETVTGFKEESKFFAEIVKHNDLIYAKPTTFMNNSGRAVQSILNYYKFETDQLLVIYDDLDLELGSFKIQFAKAPKAHNGVISVIDHIGDNFWNLRLGIDFRSIEQKEHMEGTDYVLGKFSSEELSILLKTFDKIKADLQIGN